MEAMYKVSITSKTNELQNGSPEVVDNKEIVERIKLMKIY
jgi:hypothetical protein